MFGLLSSLASGRLSSSTSKLNSDPFIPSLSHSPIISHAAVGVGKLLFPIFALALDLPEDYFDDKVRYNRTFSPCRDREDPLG